MGNVDAIASRIDIIGGLIPVRFCLFATLC